MSGPTWEDRVAALNDMRHHKDAQYPTCKECGHAVEWVDPRFGLCRACKKTRDRVYDDYVDPIHWYHQHDPERTCEG